jgi:membrane-bound lytic murein transglycosylase MltF
MTEQTIASIAADLDAARADLAALAATEAEHAAHIARTAPARAIVAELRDRAARTGSRRPRRLARRLERALDAHEPPAPTLDELRDAQARLDRAALAAHERVQVEIGRTLAAIAGEGGARA